jgi:hypothetical protein
MENEYLPSPEAIRQECERIRAGWTKKERARRERGSFVRARIPLVRIRTLPLEVEKLLLDKTD